LLYHLIFPVKYRRQVISEPINDYLKDEIVRLSSNRVIETGISEHKLRLVHVYKEDEDKVIAIISNQLDWEYNTLLNYTRNAEILNYSSRL
jgi:REP element-mobilizing transposase RayT